MRTFLRIVNTAMIMAIVTIAVATTPSPPFKFQVIDANSFVLYLNNQGGNEIKVSIKDQRNNILHADELKAEVSAAKRYNLENLPAGSYVLVIENDLGISEHEITLSEENMAIGYESLNYFAKPLIVENGEFLDIMFSSIEVDPVKVRIYSTEDMVFSETLESDDLIQRRYDISQLEKGEYRIHVRSNGKVFTKGISVK